MSINNKEDVNRYYDLINKLVDDYIDNWKIKPSNLKNYLKPGSQAFNRFLERNKLSNIKGTSTILKDIINDRESMESDGIISFESFRLYESDEFKLKSLKHCLNIGIDKTTISQEKILADYFDTNLGEIDIIDPDSHLYKLNDWENDDWKVIIYSTDEINIILENIINYLYNELSNNNIKLTTLIEIKLSDLIKKDKFEDKIRSILTQELLIKTITSCIENFKYKGEYKKNFIWIK